MGRDEVQETTGTTESVTGLTPKVADELSLVVASGPDEGARLSLKWGSYTIGKSRSCDLSLSDPGVSRRHLLVERRAESLAIRDLESSNGSYFNGARFDEIEVGIGAMIQVGRTLLRVVADDVADDEGAVAHFGKMVGGSAPMRRVFRFLRRVARSGLAVLIQGETGTGKELVAQGIHEASGRTGKLVVADLAGIAPSLMESELFGHARGAFTGADRERAGVFEEAHGGTIFLDEIGELPLEQQPRLLRALESAQIKRVGENTYRNVDVRIVAATNRNLVEEVREGRFRSDLLHRLAVFRVELPPLRDRPDDIPLLVQHFVLNVAPSASVRVRDETMHTLMCHDWPGNLRELRNVVERAVALADEDGTVRTEILGLDEDRPEAERTGASASLALPFKEAKERLVDTWERDYVTTLLDACEGNVSLAARRAGMHRVHLHRLLKKHAGC